jgi:hypothetical protein
MTEAQQIQAIKHFTEYNFRAPIVDLCEWSARESRAGVTEFARCIYVSVNGKTRRADFIVEFPRDHAHAIAINASLADGTEI